MANMFLPCSSITFCFCHTPSVASHCHCMFQVLTVLLPHTRVSNPFVDRCTQPYLTLVHLIEDAAIPVIQKPSRVPLLLPALEGFPCQAHHAGLMLLVHVTLQEDLLQAVVYQSCIAVNKICVGDILTICCTFITYVVNMSSVTLLACK